jgi:hypothetical protein
MEVVRMADETKTETKGEEVKAQKEKPKVATKPKKARKAKAALMTKEEKRAYWNKYRKDNAAKYLAWSRGWRSGSKLTFQEFNAKWDKEHAEKK